MNTPLHMNIKLRFPVHTLDGRPLLQAGTILSQERLDRLIHSRHSPAAQNVNLIQYGSIKDDILRFLRQAPYSRIFSDQKRIATIINVMQGVNLILPVLKSLDYFRHNDYYTYRHILMVFALSILLAHDLVEDNQDLMHEVAAGPTHDFGKICVPLKALIKSNPLTLTERNMIEHHAVAGYVLLSYYLKDNRNLAARVARDHHERKDGSGYPKGILLEDRLVEIIVVSDVYDALISQRPYRSSSYNNRTALEVITEMAEIGKLSWEVIQVLVAHNRQSKHNYRECKVSLLKRGTPPADNYYGVIAV